MMTRRFFTVSIFFVVFVGVLPSCGWNDESINTAGLSQVVLRIEGLTWATWPFLVKRALVGLDGVKKAEVSFSRSQAVVYYESEKVSVTEMIKAVKRVGFGAHEQ